MDLSLSYSTLFITGIHVHEYICCFSDKISKSMEKEDDNKSDSGSRYVSVNCLSLKSSNFYILSASFIHKELKCMHGNRMAEI